MWGSGRGKGRDKGWWAAWPTAVLTVILFGMGAVARTQGYYPAGLEGGPGSSLRLWLDAQDSTTMSLTGGRVSAWRDKSGHANDCIQTYALMQPSINMSAFGSGRPGVEIPVGSWLAAPDNVSLSPQEASIAIIVQPPPSASAFVFAAKGGNSGSWRMGAHTGSYLYVAADDGGWREAPSSVPLTSVLPELLCGLVTNTELQLFRGASPSPVAVRSLSGAMIDHDDSTAVGDARGLAAGGIIGELLFFGHPLNISERVLLANYAHAKWDASIDSSLQLHHSASHRRELIGVLRTNASDMVMASAGSSAGMRIAQASGFLRDDGDALLAAHRGDPSFVVSFMLGGVPWARWSRAWQVEVTDQGSTGGEVVLEFDFRSYHGASWYQPMDPSSYGLLYHASDPEFGAGARIISTASFAGAAAAVRCSVDAAALANGYYTLAALTPGALCSGTITDTGAVLGSCIGTVSMEAGASAALRGSAALVGSLTLRAGAHLALDTGARMLVRGCLTMEGGSINGSGAIEYDTSGVLRYAAHGVSTTSSAEFPAVRGPATLEIATSDTVYLHAQRGVRHLRFTDAAACFHIGIETFTVSVLMDGGGSIRSRAGRLRMHAPSGRATIDSIRADHLEVDVATMLQVRHTVSIIDSLILLRGIVVTDTNRLELGPTAQLRGETQARRVDGTIRTRRPVSYRMESFGNLGIDLDARMEDLGMVTLERHSGSAVQTAGGASIRRWWRIVPDRQPAGPIDVTLRWRLVEMNGRDPSAMHVWRSPDHGITWQDLTRDDALATLADSMYSLVFSTPGFSDFTVSDPLAPLPVELTRFSAQWRDQAVHLAWTTASETNCAAFLVQRRSVPRESNGTWGFPHEWETITRVEGGGTTSGERNYRYSDPLPPQGGCTAAEYRLLQLDRDGSRHEHPSIRVDAVSRSDEPVAVITRLALHPHPAYSTARLDFELSEATALSIRIVDLQGRILHVQTPATALPSGSHHIALPCGSLTSGVYLLEISAGAHQRIIAFQVVQK